MIDEGTSAVDRDSVDALFQHAKKRGITMFTISHSDMVDVHHVRALDLAKGGVWSLTDDVSTPRDDPPEPNAEVGSVALDLIEQLEAKSSVEQLELIKALRAEVEALARSGTP